MTKAQHKAALEKNRKVTSASTNGMDEGMAASSPQHEPPKKSCIHPTARGQQIKEDMPVIKDTDSSLALASDLLMNLLLDIWWRLLQDPDGELDVKYGTRQDLSLIIPVYLQSGLFSAPPIGMESYKL